MRTIELKRYPYGDGWQFRIRQGYSVVAGQYWYNANTIDEIRKQHPDLPIEYFAPDERTKLTHLATKINRMGMVTAVENFDTAKVRAYDLSDLWPAESQLKFLRNEAVSIPDDLTNISDALRYASENEPSLTIDSFWEEATKRVKSGLAEKLGSCTEVEIVE